MWAWAVTHGGKRIENRPWKTIYRGRILIHAGKSKDPKAWDLLAQIIPPGRMPNRMEVNMGAVVATANLVGIIEPGDDFYVDWLTGSARRIARSQEKWFVGPFGWVLEDVVTVGPISMNGKLGLFYVDPDSFVGRRGAMKVRTIKRIPS